MTNSKVTVALLTHIGAPQSVLDGGKESIEKIIDKNNIVYSETNPDILFFLSGGSERKAINLVKDESRNYILLTIPTNNSLASALEVKSYLDNKKILAQVVSINDKHITPHLGNLARLRFTLNASKIGVVGTPSDWLVNSVIEVTKPWSPEFVHLPWDKVGSFKDCDTDSSFIKHFENNIDDKSSLTDASRIYTQLKTLVEAKKLDALTVECFSLVKKHSVTGCLALSRLSDDGVVAGCEGDMVSVLGLFLIQKLVGTIPWMANVTDINEGKIFFAHCTAPTDLVSQYSIRTHYETDLGTAIEGSFSESDVTILRLHSSLTKGFVEEGRVVKRPTNPGCCRTQIEVEVSKSCSDKLISTPLGNHHIIIPGKQSKIIALALSTLGIKVI